MAGKFDLVMNDLKLTSTLSYSNMHAFDLKGAIKKYDHPHDIIVDFVQCRSIIYKKRRDKMLANYSAQCQDLMEKMRFLTLTIEGKIELRNTPKKKLEEILAQLKFKAPYDTYLSMPLWSITKERV